jgi:hypothetical protein
VCHFPTFIPDKRASPGAALMQGRILNVTPR